mmetsp:Transcript_20522/g.56891  ORF Transcript_20522/g.56891 Transcript_20522/m.56891 type:complete len:301 (-) Transcript_20522:563-1465(-)
MSMFANNVFSLLDDENEDPQAVAAKAAAQQEAAAASAKKAAATAAAESAKAPSGRPQSARPGRGNDSGRGGRGGRGGYDRRPGGEGGEVAEFDGGSPQGRGRGRGGRGRGERRPYNNEGGEARRVPRRDYDRHSGTGRGHEVQKRGAGKGNWGSMNDAVENPQEGGKAEEGYEVPKADDVEGEAPVEGETEAVEEVKELTLEEYEKQMHEKKKSMGWVADSTAVKEVDMSQFSGMKVARKPVEDEVEGFGLSDAKKKEKAAKAEKARKEVGTQWTPEPLNIQACCSVSQWPQYNRHRLQG